MDEPFEFNCILFGDDEGWLSDTDKDLNFDDEECDLEDTGLDLERELDFCNDLEDWEFERERDAE